MLKEAIAQGATAEEALANACRELGVETTEVEFEILEMPTKKTFGLFGGKPAKVRAYIEEEEETLTPAEPVSAAPSPAAPVKEEKPAAPAKPRRTDGNDPAEKAAEYLKSVLREMGLPDVEVSITRDEAGAALSLGGEGIGFIIGHRGETLDALQYLASLVANHVEDAYYRITLDVGNYREKRKETLESLGRRMAIRAVKTGRNSSLEPMNPYERRIIHTAVQTVEGAKSWSEGEDMNRHVVIGPEGGERAPRRNDRRGGSRRSGYDRRGGGSHSPRSSAPRESQAPRAEGPKQDDPGAPIYGKIEVKK